MALVFGSDEAPEVGVMEIKLEIGVAYVALVRSETSDTDVAVFDDILLVITSGRLASIW